MASELGEFLVRYDGYWSAAAAANPCLYRSKQWNAGQQCRLAAGHDADHWIVIRDKDGGVSWREPNAERLSESELALAIG